jgi:hypothetical protein
VVLFEQVEEDAEGLASGRRELGVAGDDEFGVVGGGLEEVVVEAQVREVVFGEAGLAVS